MGGLESKLLFIDFGILFLCKSTSNTEKAGCKRSSYREIEKQTVRVSSNDSQKQIDQRFMSLLMLLRTLHAFGGIQLELAWTGNVHLCTICEISFLVGSP